MSDPRTFFALRNTSALSHERGGTTRLGSWLAAKATQEWYVRFCYNIFMFVFLRAYCSIKHALFKV